MKAFVYDLNKPCVSNGYLASCLAAFLERNAMARTEDLAAADVVLVLGCNEHERNAEVASVFQRLAAKHPGKKVVSLGCTPALPADARRGADNFTVLPLWKLLREPDTLGDLLGAERPFAFKSAQDALEGRSIPSVESRYPDASSLCCLRIADGCLGRCTFCAIVHGKGALRSVPLEAVLRDVRAGLAQGKRRFVFMGEDAGPWGRDLGLEVGTLLGAITALDPEIRLLIHAFNPRFLEESLPALERSLDRIELLSLPIQSGSQRVLDLMKREYDIERVLGLVRRLKGRGPRLVTDAIIGFPTETRRDFTRTLRAAALFDATYFFVCTERPFTPAAKLGPKVARPEIDRRIELVRRGKEKHNFCDAYLR